MKPAIRPFPNNVPNRAYFGVNKILVTAPSPASDNGENQWYGGNSQICGFSPSSTIEIQIDGDDGAKMMRIWAQSQRAGPLCQIPNTDCLPFKPSASTALDSWPLNSHNSSKAPPRRGPAVACRRTARNTRPPALIRRSAHATWPGSKLTFHPLASLFSIQNSWP